MIFQEVEAADMCVATLNNRLYEGRTLQVATWDGKTKYKYAYYSDSVSSCLGSVERGGGLIKYMHHFLSQGYVPEYFL